MPITVPSTKLMTVAVPTSTTVHQMCWPIDVVTGALPRLSDRPRSPCSSMFQ